MQKYVFSDVVTKVVHFSLVGTAFVFGAMLLMTGDARGGQTLGLERRAIQPANRRSIHPVGPRDIGLRPPITHARDSFLALMSIELWRQTRWSNTEAVCLRA